MDLFSELRRVVRAYRTPHEPDLATPYCLRAALLAEEAIIAIQEAECALEAIGRGERPQSWNKPAVLTQAERMAVINTLREVKDATL